VTGMRDKISSIPVKKQKLEINYAFSVNYIEIARKRHGYLRFQKYKKRGFLVTSHSQNDSKGNR
jgi:hypothetical protein